MNDTDYKTALVTGASSGIGYATVKKLTAKGIKVYATARRINKLKQRWIILNVGIHKYDGYRMEIHKYAYYRLEIHK